MTQPATQGGNAAPPTGANRARLHRWGADAAITVALFVAAVAVRLPHLHLTPRYTDEVKEVMWALRIFWGEQLPLAGHNGYSGPLWNYLLAGLFALVGPSTAMPRTVVMLLGALTVVATYALARAMSGRTAGFIAGALMATSFVPVYVNSHVAWSICVTPLLTTLALTALYLGVRRSNGPLVVLFGLLTGLAMQAHPLGVLLVPAAGVWAVLQPEGRRLLRTPWPYLAALLAAFAYGNMIWFHVASRFETVTRALDKLSDGVPGALTLADYRHNVESLMFNLLDLLTAQGHHATDLFRADPATFVRGATVLLLFGLAYAAWRSESLPLVVVVVTAALMPVVNSEYGFPLGARYLSFLLPVTYAGFGLAAAALLAQLRARSPTAHRIGAIAVGLTVAALVLYPLRPLGSAYRQAEARGHTNALVHELADVARAEHAAGATVLLSEKIEAKFSGGGHIHRVMATLLGLSDVPTVKVHKDLKRIDEQLARCAGATQAGSRAGTCVLIIAVRQADELAERYAVEPIPLSRAPLPEDGEAYGIYRVGPLE
jgi:4-amino-4-deoxy-L-arabinose transferase-like glycosyltransferase